MATTPDGGPAVLRHTAAWLDNRPANLADQVSARVREAVPYWRDRIDRAQLWVSTYQGLETVVQALTDGHGDGSHARALGHDAARRGVALTPMIHAYRLAASALWDLLVDAAALRGPQQARDLADGASEYWQAALRDIEQMSRAYRQSTTERPTEEAISAALLGRLLRRPPDTTAVARAVDILALPRDGRYAVLRFRDPLRVDTTALSERAGATMLPAESPSPGTVLVALLDESGVEGVIAAVSAAHPGRAGVISPAITGLAKLPRANELAECALRQAHSEPALVPAERQMYSTLIRACYEPAIAAAGSALEPVIALAEAERERLLDALGAWLDCHGNTDRAARRLFCHPNTIRNRLRHVERLTDCSLTRPGDLVALTLAFESHRLRTRTATEG